MVNLKNKKAAVELSLNLIIMLIIGMVVLGLVIGFVNSLVNKGTESFDKQLGDNEKLKLEEVTRCSDNFCISPDPSIEVGKGESPNLYIKVRGYAGAIACPPGDLNDGGCEVTYALASNDGEASDSGITVTGPGFNTEEGGDDSQRCFLNVAKTTPIGIYYLTFTLDTEGDEETAVSKTITISVK